jgi:putative ABC transport system permease protein
MSALRRRLRRLVLGEAGPAPALVLAGVALVIAFIVAAGPRALAVADNRATSQAVAQAPALDTAVEVNADLKAQPANGVLSARAIDSLASRFAAKLPGHALFPASQHWGGVILPSLPVKLTAPSPDGRAQVIETAYRSEFARHSAVVAGSLPTGPAVVRPAAAGKGPLTMLNIALTRVTAATFGVRVGSVLNVGSAFPGGPAVLLKVVGIVKPLDPDSGFWQHDPELRVPSLEGPMQSPHWLGCGFVGAAELRAVGAAYGGQTERATWFFPMTTHLAAADVPRIESGVARLASGPVIRNVEVAAGASVLADTATSTALADGLAAFNSQWHTTVGVNSVLVVGLFVAGVALLLICCGLAAQAYRPELVLLRVRGGSLRQMARRIFARSCCIALPALAAGVALAVAVVPGGGSSWILVGLTALAAVTATPLICVLEHRRLRLGTVSPRTDAIPGRSSARRLVAELAVLLVAAAALADLRLRGAGQQAGGVAGTTSAYLSASAVLVAGAVALVVNRAYRGPLRLLAGAASIRRGAVGAVGLARAAAIRVGTVLPAVALMLGLTLTVFSAMVLASISNGQIAGSWQRVGADALITVSGTSSVTPQALRTIDHVPGVDHATSVFTAQASGVTAAQLTTSSGAQPVGIAAVNPSSYAALAGETPWPAFPTHALAKPASTGNAPVPLLITPSVAAQLAQAGGRGQLRLEVYGQFVKVRIAGTITATPAMPTGGEFVVMPRWAEVKVSSLPPPYTVLVTGPHLRMTALRKTAERLLPGSQVIFRRQVLGALNSSPALRLSEGLYVAGAVAAAVVSALAVLFYLASSARSRAAMLARLGALGMARSQALLLGMTEAVPLIAVAAAGTAACVWLLAVVVGPVLGLNTFTGSREPAALSPTWPDLFVPLAGAALLAVAFLAIDGVFAGRRKLALALRQEEAG